MEMYSELYYNGWYATISGRRRGARNKELYPHRSPDFYILTGLGLCA